MKQFKSHELIAVFIDKESGNDVVCNFIIESGDWWSVDLSHDANLKSVRIPNAATEIDLYAFDGCVSLEYVVISDNVKEIGEGAFDGCIKLKSIYYLGATDQYGIFNDIPSTITIYYYSENKPIGAGNYWHFVDKVPTSW